MGKINLDEITETINELKTLLKDFIQKKKLNLSLFEIREDEISLKFRRK